MTLHSFASTPGLRGAARACTARALAGLTPATFGTLFGLGVVWALGHTGGIEDWRENGPLAWFINLGYELSCHLAIVASMGLPIVAAFNLGPASAWRRIVLLAATIALTAPLAALIRYAWTKGAYADDPTYVWGWSLFVTYWVRYGGGAALLAFVYEFHRREARALEAMHRAEIDRIALEREMEQARLLVLQAQIEPHFLFNTLANVRRLYQTNLAAGREMLDNLMRYLEVALPRMRESRSTLEREIALVEAYLDVQRIRMGRRLSYAIDIPAELRALEMPPMMLLTLVENAIKHGLNPLPEGGFIGVRAERLDERLRIEVADTGRGFTATKGGGTGLANVRARLAAEHGGGASLALAEHAPRGVSAVLMLPIARAR